jgi:tetratricopeptide (TPR) repeat protein
MLDNFSKLVIDNGGEIKPLILPSSQTQGLPQINPSILVEGDDIHLNLRHLNYILYHSEGKQRFQSIWGPLAYLNPEDDITLTTNNYLCKLDPDTLEIVTGVKVDTTKLDVKPLWEFIGLEDVRLVNWDDKFYYTGVRRDTTTNGVGRMELSEIVNNAEISRNRIEPPTSSYCEKNWMPILDMPYHYVKWTFPLEVVKVDPITNTSETVVKKENIKDFPRDVRGGSQVIPFGDYRIALTHEVDLWNNENRRKDGQYYHRFIVWDKDWNVVTYTDDFKFMTARIEFACGMAVHKDHILVTFAFQDTTSFLLKIPVEFFTTFIGLEHNEYKGEVKQKGEIVDFLNNPFDPTLNFKLGRHYEKTQDYASALSFYLRCAEFDDEPYTALIRVAKCLDKQGRRPASTKHAYLNALANDPTRPEAYLYLSMWHESKKEWQEAYSYACQGLVNGTSAPSAIDVDYPGIYALIFQKAVSSWWIGRTMEAREILQELVAYRDIMNPRYLTLIQNNITSLGSGPNSIVTYNKSMYDSLKYKFTDSDKIEKNHSQTYQDMFVLAMLDGKKKGTYLEIGAERPFFKNNTALLETNYDWTGVSLEILPDLVDTFNKERKNKAILADATKVDYDVFIQEHFDTTDIDYLQVDCEPPSVTLEILQRIPLDKYRFAVITFEHDYYADITRSYREKSREYLTSKGYELAVSDIAADDIASYEDWWVHPELVNPETVKQMKNTSHKIKNAEKYMLNKLN